LGKDWVGVLFFFSKLGCWAGGKSLRIDF